VSAQVADAVFNLKNPPRAKRDFSFPNPSFKKHKIGATGEWDTGAHGL